MQSSVDSLFEREFREWIEAIGLDPAVSSPLIGIQCFIQFCQENTFQDISADYLYYVSGHAIIDDEDADGVPTEAMVLRCCRVIESKESEAPQLLFTIEFQFPVDGTFKDYEFHSAWSSPTEANDRLFTEIENDLIFKSYYNRKPEHVGYSSILL